MNENYFQELYKHNQELLDNIKAKLPELEKLLEEVNDHWCYQDLIYRFYHNSYKVYWIQDITLKIVVMLKSLAPEGVTFNEKFEQMFKEGTEKIFKSSHNRKWEKHTRPMVEVFFHAKYFLEMAVIYGKELDKAPECLPSGWAALLYFYGLR